MKIHANKILIYLKYVLFLMLFLGLSYALLYLAYENVKSEMIAGLNNRQMIHAKQAARGIETFIKNHIAILRQLAKNEHIVDLDETGMKRMQEFYASRAGEISIITRIDAQGRILYSVPYDANVIHQPIIKIKEFQDVKKTGQVTVSDVFTNLRGFKSIIMHVPVFKKGSFNGTLSLLLPFEVIASRYVKDIRIGQDGYAWVISKDGIELSCPVPGHAGNSVFTTCRDFPDILAMAKRMIKGEQGITTYQFDRIRQNMVTQVTKHAFFMPIRLENTFWSIVIATPEDEVIGALEDFRNKLILIGVLLVLGTGALLYVLFRNNLLVKEIERRRMAEKTLQSDIVQRRQAEEALRNSQRSLAEVIDFLPDATFVIDQTGKVTAWNRAIEKMTGIKAEAMIGKGGHEYAIPFYGKRRPILIDLAILSDDAFLQGHYDDINRQGTSLSGEVWTPSIYGGKGAYLWATASTLFHADGNIIGAIESVRDITDRKRTEGALRESEQKYRVIAENMTDVIAIMDMNLRFTFISPSVMRLRGFTVEEAMTQSIEQIMTPGSRRMIDKIFEEETKREASGRGNTDKVRIIELALYRKDMSTVWVEASGSFLHDRTGRTVGILCVVRDITKRKRSEEALRESEVRYQSIFENTGTGMLIVEEDMTISFVNAEFEKLTGYTRQEIEGKRRWTDFVDKADLERMIQQHKLRLMDRTLAKKSDEFRLVPKNDQRKDVYMTADIITGTPKTVASLMDITDYKKAELERQELGERLKRSEKMEALGLLAGGVAHDLNNILGVLIGYAELLLHHIETSSPVKSYAANIMGASERAAAMIQDMLTLARRGVQTRNAVNLNTLVSDFLKTLEFEKISTFHPHVKIMTHLEAAPLPIMGSSVQLGKTIMNLISNAAEAMPKGGVLTITTSNQYLDRPVRGYDEIREGDYAVLSVSDSGEGISTQDINRIFEPFYTKKVMGRSGTGLGLSVVWGTVKDHNGYIDVQSEEGKGSVFTLYFPVTREELSKNDIPVSMADYMGRGESVLVVDDIKVQRELAERMLEKLNYQVDVVSSGEEAYEYLKVHHADLVVLDMIMEPGMDGFATYRKILEIRPRQKAIIVSGFSETDRVKQAQALGAGAYVRKPYRLEQIGLAVRKELDRPA